MVDIVDTLITLLCQQGTQSNCQNFIAQYPDVVQQVLWMVFFPGIFLLIFIMLLARGVAGDNSRKVGSLLAIGLFLFIIFQGWYHYFLNISKFWFVSVIVLGGLYVFTHRMGPAHGNGGNARNQFPYQGKKKNTWMREAVFGTTVLDPREVARNRKLCDQEIGDLKKKRESLEKRLGSGKVDTSRIMPAIAEIDKAIAENEQRKSRGEPPIKPIIPKID